MKFWDNNWYIIILFCISIVVFACACLIIKVLIAKRKSFQYNFEASGNKKLTYNLWNLVLVCFIGFSGIVGFLITGAILLGSF